MQQAIAANSNPISFHLNSPIVKEADVAAVQQGDEGVGRVADNLGHGAGSVVTDGLATTTTLAQW